MTKDIKNRGFSEAEISRKAKLHPFVVKKALKSSIDLGEAIKTYNTLLAVDTGFKTGQANLEDSLYNLLLI